LLNRLKYLATTQDFGLFWWLNLARYEAAQSATRLQSPDYSDYHALKARGLTHTRASLTIARKIARRSYHLLHALGPAAIEPVA
jgi:transposase